MRTYNAPRCGARTRAGRTCLRPVVKDSGCVRNRRCPSHGGRSTGPRRAHDPRSLEMMLEELRRLLARPWFDPWVVDGAINRAFAEDDQ